MTQVTLQSKDHRELLDIIDKLRSQGTSRYVDLPEIVVCGDQSAGKSSVLEAISGMSFPTKDNLCTRFATELVLRRSPTTGVKVSITPAPDRSEAEKKKLREFAVQIGEHGVELGDVVETAKAAMDISDTKVFSSDTLRVELYGPTQPHLTMVDLPGLFRAGNKDQTVEDARTVTLMVRGYMARPRSIILAVVSASSDFALQDVTTLSRKLDPNGTRTLGLITKPDKLDKGSDSELSYLHLAENKDVFFHLGWHVLKNRSYEMRNSTLAERDADEAEFFSQGVWKVLDSGHVGIGSLRPRLSRVLTQQILLQLPGLVRDIRAGIDDCNRRLECLGASRTTPAEQRRYLSRISQEFSALMKMAVDGTYYDAFFACDTKKGYSRRLRAVVQNTLSNFAKDMRRYGWSQKITNDKGKASSSDNDDDDDNNDTYRNAAEKGDQADDLPLPTPEKITRSEYIKAVGLIMSKSRGRELAGMFNPVIVEELFAAQCKPWRQIADNVRARILDAVETTTMAILEHVIVEETAAEIGGIISEGMEDLKTALDIKISELLDPHENGHPITYNHYLTDNVQKAQTARMTKALKDTLTSFFGTHSDTGRWPAHSDVAVKKFVDDVSTLAVEQCLIRKLPKLFTPSMVLEMDDAQVHRLAAESEWASAERTRCTEKLNTLQTALRDLKLLERHQGPSNLRPAALKPATLEPYNNLEPATRDSITEPATSELGLF